jgi:hypothetical protein
MSANRLRVSSSTFFRGLLSRRVVTTSPTSPLSFLVCQIIGIHQVRETASPDFLPIGARCEVFSTAAVSSAKLFGGLIASRTNFSRFGFTL